MACFFGEGERDGGVRCFLLSNDEDDLLFFSSKRGGGWFAYRSLFVMGGKSRGVIYYFYDG